MCKVIEAIQENYFLGQNDQEKDLYGFSDEMIAKPVESFEISLQWVFRNKLRLVANIWDRNEDIPNAQEYLIDMNTQEAIMLSCVLEKKENIVNENMCFHLQELQMKLLRKIKKKRLKDISKIKKEAEKLLLKLLK